MNAAVNALYAEYLDHTGGDKTAAASLTLAAMFAKARTTPAGGQPLTLPEVARHLRVRPNKILGWLRSGELKGYDVTTRQGSQRPKYRVNPEDLTAFIQRRAILPPGKEERPAHLGRSVPKVNWPHLDTTKREYGPSPSASDHR